MNSGGDLANHPTLSRDERYLAKLLSPTVSTRVLCNNVHMTSYSESISQSTILCGILFSIATLWTDTQFSLQSHISPYP